MLLEVTKIYSHEKVENMLLCLLALARGLEAVLEITSYEPNKSPVEGGREITIKFSPGGADKVVCRFDTAIVQGEVSQDRSAVVCTAPSHGPGIVELAISQDGESWSSPVNFRYFDGAKAMYIVLALVIIVSIVSFGLFLLQMRQCKNEQMRHKRSQAVNINDDQSDSSDETKPLSRHAKYAL